MTESEYRGKALEIQGWMSPEELFWLFSEAATHPVIVEIGSWKGRSTHALAEGCQGVLYFVEHFAGSPAEPVNQSDSYSEVLGSDGPAFIRNTLLTNLGKFVDAGKAFLIEAKSTEAAAFMGPVFMHRQPNMVFIDGDHTYEGCGGDIKAWRKYFKKPGLLCGHDNFIQGVREAIDEFVPGWKAGPGSIWYKSDFTKDDLNGK
jgi:hypothetical protein